MRKKLSKQQLLEMLLDQESKEIKKMDEMVDLLISKNLSVDVNSERAEALTLGERMADGLAKFAGSWGFISFFMFVLVMWIIGNIFFFTHPFDPFPFILLNLVLSCIAAIQAPIIMMSQNRQEKKDRIRSENDYKINLKAEFILEDLYNKLNKVVEGQENIKNRLTTLEKEIKK